MLLKSFCLIKKRKEDNNGKNLPLLVDTIIEVLLFSCVASRRELLFWLSVLQTSLFVL